MKEMLEKLRAESAAAISEAASTEALEALRVKYLGKKGELTAILKQMGKLSAEERPVIGQLANSVRAELEAELESRKAALAEAALESSLRPRRWMSPCPASASRAGTSTRWTSSSTSSRTSS